MVDLDDAEFNQEESSIAERLAKNDPVFEPTVLNQLSQANLPLRGPLRQQIIENARQATRNRRTIEGISSRVAANVSTPITQVIEESIQTRVKSRVQQSITRMAKNIDEQR